MIRPPLEVADIIRSYGSAFVERHHRWQTVLHLKVLRAIAACRTAALGGHVEQCDRCGQRAISYNSCLNRHCPKCQAAARQRWLEKRSAYGFAGRFTLGIMPCFSSMAMYCSEAYCTPRSE